MTHSQHFAARYQANKNGMTLECQRAHEMVLAALERAENAERCLSARLTEEAKKSFRFLKKA